MARARSFGASDTRDSGMVFWAVGGARLAAFHQELSGDAGVCLVSSVDGGLGDDEPVAFVEVPGGVGGGGVETHVGDSESLGFVLCP